MLVRPPADHRVDGSDVEAPRGVELTDPKRPRGLPHAPRPAKRGWARDCWCSRPLCCSGHTDRKPRPRGLRRPVSETVPVAMAEGKHPVPYRTRKLSLPAPMVLHAGACGRVGDRRTTHTIPAGGREPHQGPPPPAGDNHSTTTPAPDTPPDNRAADRTRHDSITNQTHRPDGADPLVHLCSSSHSSIGSLRSRAGRNHEQVIGSFERSGASS